MAARKVKRNWSVLGIRVVAGLIALITGAVSYTHTFRVMIMGHQPVVIALGCAALPDLLMAMALIKMSVKRAPSQRVSAWVVSSFWFGLLLSLAANAYSAWQDGYVATVVSVFPPAFVMLAVEMVRHANKTVARKARKAPVKAAERVTRSRTAKVGALVPAGA